MLFFKFSRPVQAMIVLLGGLLMGLTPAPVQAWPLAWVALVPLWWVVLYGKTPSVWWGILWGIGYHGSTLAWIRGLHPLTWMGIPWAASVAIVLFCWVFITLWGAVMVGLWAIALGWLVKLTGFAKGTPALPWWLILVGTALWCGLEWLWSLGPLCWTSLSFTQSPHNLVILHLGQLSGPAMITGAIVAVNGCFAVAIAHLLLSPLPVAATRRKATVGAIAAIALLLISHGVGWGLYSRPLADAPESNLKIGIIQGNIPTRIKLSPEGIRRALQGYTRGYELLAMQGADAVITPEGAFPFPWTNRNWQDNPLYQAIGQSKIPVWLGAFGLRQGRLTQNLFTLGGDGTILSHYEKIKLVPLGEYLPFEPVVGRLIGRLSPIASSMVPGAFGQRLDTPFGRAIAGICYDSAFSEIFRQQAAAGGQFILTASNNDPYNGTMMAQHHAQDVLRAVESDRWTVRATNTGYSGLVDPHGHTRWLSQRNQYSLYIANLYRRQTRTAYVQWGDWFTPLLVILSGVSWMGWRRQSLSWLASSAYSWFTSRWDNRQSSQRGNDLYGHDRGEWAQASDQIDADCNSAEYSAEYEVSGLQG